MIYIESREFMAGLLSHVTEPSKRYSLAELCNAAYAMESKQGNVCVNIDNEALSYLCSASGNTIEVTNEYVFISDMQNPKLQTFIERNRPQEKLAALFT